MPKQRRYLKRTIALILVIAGVWFASACSVGYYSQAVGGHLKLMAARQPIERLLKAEDTDEELRAKLQTLVDAKAFAIERLSLPNNDSYKSYAETGKRYITWNVVASEEFSLSAQTWCFPVAGCVSYRGYFAQEDAEAFAQELRDQNFDVSIGGATAYSTLGWFDDPVLDTMLRGGDIRYVGILFHELAHQLLYVKDDSSFNEAFASFVEQEGVRIWLEERGQSDRIALYDAYLARSDDFNALLKRTRAELVKLYELTLPEEQMRERKAAIFTSMRAHYEELKASWNGYKGYDGWFKRELNNARLISVSTYQRFIPAFAGMYLEAGEDLPEFYKLAKSISELPISERRERLNSYFPDS
ncbi:MAG: aminopeptidase [Gammaproteobacteria bacterium]|nr:aminopeptidase [Gammaproteobacteria bacterium]